MRCGIAGMSMWVMPNFDNASTSAFITAGNAASASSLGVFGDCDADPSAQHVIIFVQRYWCRIELVVQLDPGIFRRELPVCLGVLQIPTSQPEVTAARASSEL